MNRLSSLITAGLTTGLSAAALGATAMAQGIFGGASDAPEDTSAVQQITDATVAAPPAAVATATQESPTPQVIYVDKEPIVVTRQVQVPGASASSGQRGSEDGNSPAGPATTAAPAQASAPAQAPASSPNPAPAPSNSTAAWASADSVSTAGMIDDNGGLTPRDSREEPGDDRDSDDEEDDAEHEDDRGADRSSDDGETDDDD